MPSKPPVVFDVDAIMADVKAPFDFTVGGKDYHLPNFSTLTTRQALALGRGEVEAVLAEITDQATADVLLDLPGYVGDAITVAWTKHAGEKPGEGKASSR